MDIKNTYLGFTDNMNPMQKAKVEKLLCNVKKYDGIVITNKQFIYNELKARSKPKVKEDVQHWSRKKQDYTKPKTEYRIRSQEEYGSYYVIEKTLYDFAVYILNNNFLNSEKVEIFITEEQNKVKAEEQLKAEQDKQKKVQEQVRIDFDKWLDEQAKNYNNSEKLELLREIFLVETGQFGGDSIRLLVLIDNFDNPLCKNKLREWLGYYNTASLKTFFHITGINLGRTDKEIQVRLDSITSKDFTGMLTFKPRKERTEKELEVFYTYSFNSINNKYEFQECKGEHFNKYGLNFFISKTNRGYNITEGTSGLSIGRGNTKQKAMNILTESINRIGIDELKKGIERSINRTSISPKYKQEIAI